MLSPKRVAHTNLLRVRGGETPRVRYCKVDEGKSVIGYEASPSMVIRPNLLSTSGPISRY